MIRHAGYFAGGECQDSYSIQHKAPAYRAGNLQAAALLCGGKRTRGSPEALNAKCGSPENGLANIPSSNYGTCLVPGLPDALT